LLCVAEAKYGAKRLANDLRVLAGLAKAAK